MERRKAALHARLDALEEAARDFFEHGNPSIRTYVLGKIADLIDDARHVLSTARSPGGLQAAVTLTRIAEQQFRESRDLVTRCGGVKDAMALPGGECYAAGTDETSATPSE
jgi:hypothetical protein